MVIGFRTLLRHLGVVLALAAVVPVVFRALGGDLFRMLSWLLHHLPFLASWLTLCVGLGVLSFVLARGRTLQRILLAGVARLRGVRFARATFRAYRRGELGPIPRGFLAWASCPRCVSYWLGGISSITLNAIYWPRWPGSVYFGAFGASLSAVVAVSLILLADSRRSRRAARES